MNRLGFKIVKQDLERPWGGFFVIAEDQTELFLDTYFSDLDKATLMEGGRLSPKILLVAPQKRLSWQYHFRRAEQWRVLEGPVAVAQSTNDDQPAPKTFQGGALITLAQGERHRLIGLTNWGIVAEIWQHTNPAQPSDESDIVRLQDDFKRV
ncbi:MAG: phosphoheptose isomerase [Bacteroidota bacterium]